MPILTQTDKLDNLIAMLATAFSWAHLLGEWVYEQRPLPLKKHGYLPISFFKRGLSYLRAAILAESNQPAILSLAAYVQLLSP